MSNLHLHVSKTSKTIFEIMLMSLNQQMCLISLHLMVYNIIRLFIRQMVFQQFGKKKDLIDFDLIFGVLMPLSAIFQLYRGDQFQWWKKPEYPERTTDHGNVTGKLYHLRLRVECTLFCNLQSRVRNHAVLLIGLYELLGNPTT